jgi:hypothetical protein
MYGETDQAVNHVLLALALALIVEYTLQDMSMYV